MKFLHLLYPVQSVLLYLLCFLLNLISLHAQHITESVIRVRVQYPDRSESTSFGFILGEKNDSLYIVTVSNIYISEFEELAEKIIIDYYPEYASSFAVPIGIDDERNCMILRTKKPDDFYWHDDFCSASFIEVNDIVWIIGRDGDWNTGERKYIGYILSRKGYELEIELASKETGILGSLIIFNDCIAGIIISDQGNQVKAVDIDYFKLYIKTYLDIDLETDAEKPYHWPYFIVGLNGGFPIYVLGKKYPSTNNYGFFFEIGIHPNLSFRYERSYTTILTHPYAKWDSTFQFRNHLKSNSFSLLLNIQPTNFEDANFSIFIKYISGQHTPQLNIDNNGWTNLRDVSEFNDNYQDKFGALSIGLGAKGFLTERIILGYEFCLEYHFNKYLIIDPLEPFAVNKRNDWLFLFKIQTGIVIGNKKPDYKILKPKKISPFTF